MGKIKKGIIGLAVISLGVSVYHATKPLPEGVSSNSQTHYVEEVEFLYDLAYLNDGQQVYEKQILDRVFKMIDEAEEFVVLDVFLFNDEYDHKKGEYPNVSKQLTEKLIQKKKENPAIKIVLITDEMNTFYGSYKSSYFEELKKNDVEVVMTNLEHLRDSNPLYSGLWRSYIKWFGTSENGKLPNPFSPDSNDVALRSYLELLNFKANHRKVVLNEKEALVTSSNIGHDASSNHSNIAFVVGGNIVQDLYNSEKAVADFSGREIEKRDFETVQGAGYIGVKLITERQIKQEMISSLNQMKKGEEVNIGVFYLSDREVIESIISAAERGVLIKLLLDPNKDAFGIEKNGMPNRQVASEVMEKGNGNITVRWYDTHGEQYHSKFMILKGKKETIVIGGSANFTKRNIGDLNLETDLKITLPKGHEAEKEIDMYFYRIWNNENGQYTLPYEEYKDESDWKKWVYRFQEWSGLSTF